VKTTLIKLRRWLWCEDGQGGGASLMILTMIPALLIVFGLVIDGGAKAAALDRANRIAMEAARTGAQSISGPGDISAAAADSAAQAYLAAEDVAGTVTVTGDRVDVHVSFAEPTKVLSIIGFDEWAVEGDGFAQVIYRIGD
jgi:hypothetical protein